MERSDAHFRMMIETIPALAWSCRADGSIDFLNRRWIDYTGLPLANALGWGWKISIHPDDLEPLMDMWPGCRGSERQHEAAARLRAFDGAYRWFLFRTMPIRDEHGVVAAWYGIGIDADDRKRAEDTLRESEYRFRHLADSLPNVTWIRSLHPEQVLYTSPSFADIWGLPVEELYLHPRLWTERIHPQDRDRVKSSFTRWISGEPIRYHDVEYRIVQPNGTTRWIHEHGVLSVDNEGKPYCASGVSSDVTARKQAEAELRRSEAFLAEAQRLSRTGSFGWNVGTGELFWSRETYGILGYDPAAAPSLEVVLARTHPQDVAFVRAELDRASRDSTDLDFEHRLVMSDGLVKNVHVIARAARRESGALEYIGAVSDVTEARAAEERIRQDEREARQIVDAIPQLISVLSPNGDAIYVNKAVLDYTGLSAEDIRADALLERVIHPDDRMRLLEEIRGALPRGTPFRTEHRILGHDGAYRWFLNHFHPLLDDVAHVVRWYVTRIDIDDRKRAEKRVQTENVVLREEISRSSMYEEIIGSSAALRTALQQVAKVAPTDSTVLIMGETGTGKELIAQAIHRQSGRAAQAFIRVHCAAIPSSLFASELFGHEKGAFTGALQRRLGRFEAADGGTIFLDEIGELPQDTQPALLRVLQEREFERVGSNRPIPVDVRVLAATNRDLAAAVEAGTFRQDLYYRFHVFPIRVPSLRERADDIPPLVEYFVKRYSKKAGKRFRNVSKRTLELFQAYDWPGNVRELQNVVERAVVLCDGDTFFVDEKWVQPESSRPTGRVVPLAKAISKREREMIEAVLVESRGRISGPSGAAARLGIPRQTLESKIKHLGIDKYRFRA